MEAGAVEESALPFDGGEHLVGDGIVDEAAHGFVATAQGDGDRIVLAIEEIGGAVDGIDEPAMGLVVALGGCEFLASQAPGIF
ncbi:hypothetical protein D9M69_722740 [compost metagenome]